MAHGDFTVLLSVHFMRFLAAFAVVVHHSAYYFGSTITVGAAGVDIFFVISGVVIGYATKDGDSVWAFCLKRIIRVMPLYWLATIVYSGFKYFEWSQIPTTESTVRSMLLVPIFGTDWHPIYWPAWTLGYELFFYSLYALLLAAFSKNVTLICALIISFISVILIPVPGAEHVFVDNRLYFEFALGLVVAEFIKNGGRVSQQFGMVCAIIAIIIFSLNYKSNGIERALAWGVPSLLLVIGAFGLESSALLKSKIAILLGNASYSIYLFHITTIEFMLETLKRHGATTEILKEYQIVSIVALSTSSIAVGIFLHIVIERPLLRALRRAVFTPLTRARAGTALSQL